MIFLCALVTLTHNPTQLLHAAFQNQRSSDQSTRLRATASVSGVQRVQRAGYGGTVQAHASFGAAMAKQHSPRAAQGGDGGPPRPNSVRAVGACV